MMQPDKDYPARANRQILLNSVLNGTLYDVFDWEYHEDRDYRNAFRPEHLRAPSIRTGLAMARGVVDTAVGFCFGDGHFPSIDSDDDDVRKTLEDLVVEGRLVARMREAALIGSTGSVAVRFRVLRGRPFFDCFDTTFLTPTWDAEAPDTLLTLTEKRKVIGSELASQGYAIDDDMMQTLHWFQRVWDTAGEWWYQPWPVPQLTDKPAIPQIDDTRSVSHDLGICPWVWVHNLPGGDEFDGACTFEQGITSLIQQDYTASRISRALKYSSDPLLVVKEDDYLTDGEVKKAGGEGLLLGKEGDAKLLEMSGNSTKASLDFLTNQRGMALNSMHGVQADPEKIAMAVSGLALERLYEPMLSLASDMRSSYGEYGLLTLMRMFLNASQKMQIKVRGKVVGKLDVDARLGLKWGHWFAPTSDDRVKLATANQIAIAAGTMSRETAVKNSAGINDITSVEAEVALIGQDIVAEDARAVKLAAQTQAKETLTS